MCQSLKIANKLKGWGFNAENLRTYYNYDVKHNNYKKDFRTYFKCYIKERYKCSDYIAANVVKHFI